MSDVSHRPFSLVCITLTTLSYADFKNQNDPHDRSFDPHPIDYPVGELEFPNSGASERYVSPFFFFASARPWHLAVPFSVTSTSFMVLHAYSSLQHLLRAFCCPET